MVVNGTLVMDYRSRWRYQETKLHFMRLLELHGKTEIILDLFNRVECLFVSREPTWVEKRLVRLKA